MGSSIRGDRAGRFIAEFGADYGDTFSPPAGTTLTVVRPLVYQDDAGEHVNVGFVLRDADGGEWDVINLPCAFDPAVDGGDDMVARVARHLEVDEAVARERLTRAGLL